MSAKSTIKPFQLVPGPGQTGVLTASGDYISKDSSCQTVDRICYIADFTGTAVGEMFVETSIDEVTWVPLDMDQMPVSGVDTISCDILNTGFPFIRVKFTLASGSGNWTLFVAGKAS